MWCLFCLKAVIIPFFREVCNVLYGHYHSASFLISSSTVAPWLPIALLLLMGPGRTAAIWGFQKAAVTVSLRTTLVTSKFNLLTKAVTTSMYHLSSSVWSDGTIELVNLTTNAVVGTSLDMASIGLASWPVSQSFISGSVERTVAFSSSGGSTRPGGVCPTSSAVGKAIGLTVGSPQVEVQTMRERCHVPPRLQQSLTPCLQHQLWWIGWWGAPRELLGLGLWFLEQFFLDPRGHLICRR